MNKNRIYPTRFVFGALLLYVVLYVLPSVTGLGYSFTDWSVYSQKISFVGWKNFKTVFSSDYNFCGIRCVSRSLQPWPKISSAWRLPCC